MSKEPTVNADDLEAALNAQIDAFEWPPIKGDPLKVDGRDPRTVEVTLPDGTERGTPGYWLKRAYNAGKSFYDNRIDRYKNNWREKTRAEVAVWIEKDKLTRIARDGSLKYPGTSAGGRYYLVKKDTVQGTVGKLPPHWALFLMQHGLLPDFMRSEFMIKHFRFIDSLIREEYPDDHGILFNPEYNHRFLTEESHEEGKDGKVTSVDADKIASMFAHDNAGSTGDKFPHIIITSSHAQGDTLKDVTSITHGIEALARDSHGKPLPLGHIDKGVKPGETLILFACDVEQTPWLNAAAVMERILELKKIVRTGKTDHEFKHISPGAKRIAKLMLKCMAKDPSQINVDDPRAMAQIAADSSTPIQLRNDAIDIAHHFKLIGYSKGGNVVSDAMRYLVAELTAKNKTGQDVFTSFDVDDHTMSQSKVCNLVRNIAVMAIASIEVGLTDKEIAHGIHRFAFNNNRDFVTAHRNYTGRRYDERCLVSGLSRYAGHAPQDIMGSRDASEPGYALKHIEIVRRLREIFAPNYGKAAIGHVRFNGGVTIEAAMGTSDDQIEAYKDAIKSACAQAGLTGVSLNHSKPGMFHLGISYYDMKHDRRGLTKLSHAFQYLRDNTPGLVVDQAIISEEIAHQYSKARYSSHGVEDWEPKSTVNSKRHQGRVSAANQESYRKQA